MSCFMRTCPLIAGAPPVGPGEENRWHHANRRLQRLTAAVFRLDSYRSTEIYEECWKQKSTDDTFLVPDRSRFILQIS